MSSNLKNTPTSSQLCDLLIQNLIDDWERKVKLMNYIDDKMAQNYGIPVTKINWAKPLYSKSQIDKAGQIIINHKLAYADKSYEDYSNALTIVNNWRAAHAYPLDAIAYGLGRDNPNAIVVQRLKRLESITGKIERFPNMSLYRMQDLGGCRVIVDTVQQVYYSAAKYKNSGIPHVLKREYDYIQNPKTSGYRCYHMVYQFHSDIIDAYNKNMLIEIQFRTKLQHIWATAVEMMGIYTKSQLKSSQGDPDILRFFVLVSSVFAKFENTPVCPGTSNNFATLVDEIKAIDKKLNLISRISALSAATNYTFRQKQNRKNTGYYVLCLNYKEHTLRITPFLNSQIDLATTVYNEIEKLDNPDIDVVLVHANFFEEMQAAYPNYFMDISKFVDIMQEILD